MGEGHAPKAITGCWVKSWGCMQPRTQGPSTSTRWPPEHLGFSLVPLLTETSLSLDSWKTLVILCILSRGPDSVNMCTGLPEIDSVSSSPPPSRSIYITNIPTAFSPVSELATDFPHSVKVQKELPKY